MVTNKSVLHVRKDSKGTYVDQNGNVITESQLNRERQDNQVEIIDNTDSGITVKVLIHGKTYELPRPQDGLIFLLIQMKEEDLYSDVSLEIETLAIKTSIRYSEVSSSLKRLAQMSDKITEEDLESSGVSWSNTEQTLVGVVE